MIKIVRLLILLRLCRLGNALLILLRLCRLRNGLLIRLLRLCRLRNGLRIRLLSLCRLGNGLLILLSLCRLLILLRLCRLGNGLLIHRLTHHIGLLLTRHCVVHLLLNALEQRDIRAILKNSQNVAYAYRNCHDHKNDQNGKI